MKFDYEIKLWSADLDSTEFISNFSSIQKFIETQAPRAMSSKVSTVFALTEKGDNKIRGYYTLSSTSIIFDDLPNNLRKRLPRYPQVGATLLGRLGVDISYRDKFKRHEWPRLGELLLTHAQKSSLESSTKVASAIMLIDVEKPSEAEVETGARDPMQFYTQYGFLQLPNSPRMVFKRMSTIEQELRNAQIIA